MDVADGDLGWEDVGTAAGFGSSGVSGQIGGAGGTDSSGMPVDAMTGMMINHFTREFRKGGISFWPQIVDSVRKYFNVTHGYVLRKIVWQLIPVTPPKQKVGDGELSAEKDWTARINEGLEVEIEEPDMYIPTMGFVTYVLLCGLIQGLQEQFHPDVLSSIISYAIAILLMELVIVKAAFVMTGATTAPVIDLVAVLGYKYLYLSLLLIIGLLLGFGSNPEGFLYRLVSLGLLVSLGGALLQTMRRLTRMQPQVGLSQENIAEIHKLFLKALPVLQAVVCWLLMPSWPKRKTAAGVAAMASRAIGAHAKAGVVVAAGNASAVLAKAAAAAAAAGPP
eukprot:TRINITY_DN44630_c0_g1_i1.p1 TRINITY_DN44630_c0_g1~~TRINITY_DN44630_c0_g1_i1.p1  ORF type:complete len:336 (+),score=67.95 TRINITY_DN44630_c0_g1_i1:125-1132(+)